MGLKENAAIAITGAAVGAAAAYALCYTPPNASSSSSAVEPTQPPAVVRELLPGAPRLVGQLSVLDPFPEVGPTPVTRRRVSAALR